MSYNNLSPCFFKSFTVCIWNYVRLFVFISWWTGLSLEKGNLTCATLVRIEDIARRQNRTFNASEFLTNKNKTQIANEKSFKGPRPSFVIGTAFSSNHVCPLANMLDSVRRLHNDWTVVVYNLDSPQKLNSSTMSMLKHSGPPRTLFREFQYDKYPVFFNINQAIGEYAWKTVIIKELVDEFGVVLWMDAGNMIHEKDNLTMVLNTIRKTGFYSTKTKGDVQSFTHKGTLLHLNQSNNETLKRQRNCNGAILGFSHDSRAYHEILVPWVSCALVKECIAPTGSNKSNHRQDQSVLSILVHAKGYTCPRDNCWESNCDGVTLHHDKKKDAIHFCMGLGLLHRPRHHKNQVFNLSAMLQESMNDL
eukprot:m.90534 g.90534  ORF g.90534 m.90534 type:complete len:363 (+) comp13271_c0_seq4:63-1151(+)